MSRTEKITLLICSLCAMLYGAWSWLERRSATYDLGLVNTFSTERVDLVLTHYRCAPETCNKPKRDVPTETLRIRVAGYEVEQVMTERGDYLPGVRSVHTTFYLSDGQTANGRVVSRLGQKLNVIEARGMLEVVWREARELGDRTVVLNVQSSQYPGIVNVPPNADHGAHAWVAYVDRWSAEKCTEELPEYGFIRRNNDCDRSIDEPPHRHRRSFLRINDEKRRYRVNCGMDSWPDNIGMERYEPHATTAARAEAAGYRLDPITRYWRSASTPRGGRCSMGGTWGDWIFTGLVPRDRPELWDRAFDMFLDFYDKRVVTATTGSPSSWSSVVPQDPTIRVIR